MLETVYPLNNYMVALFKARYLSKQKQMYRFRKTFYDTFKSQYMSYVFNKSLRNHTAFTFTHRFSLVSSQMFLWKKLDNLDIAIKTQ